MKRTLAVLVLTSSVVGLATFLAWIARGGLAISAAEDGARAPWSSGPGGHLLAGSLLAECLGRPVIPWRRPFTELHEDGVLVCILPPGAERFVSPREARALVAWLARRPRDLPPTALPGRSPERANALILYCDEPNPIVAELGLLLEPASVVPDPTWTAGDPRGFAARGLPPTPRGAASRHVRLDELRHRLPLDLRPASRRTDLAMHPLYARGEHVQAGLVACGYGAAIVVADSQVATNEGLFEGDNARLVISLAGLFAGATGSANARPVWIDEYHHGRVDDAGLADVAARLLAPSTWHGVLVLVLLAWRLRARLGRPVEPEPRLARERVEFLWAKADLHRAHRHGAIVATDLRRRLGAALRRAAPAAIGPRGDVVARDKIPDHLAGPVSHAMLLGASLSDRVHTGDALGMARATARACRNLDRGRTP